MVPEYGETNVPLTLLLVQPTPLECVGQLGGARKVKLTKGFPGKYFDGGWVSVLDADFAG